MSQFIQNSLSNSLKGALSHTDPVKSILELDIQTARKKATDDSHSIWQILFHIVFWQDIFIENIKGNDPKWDDEGSWPKDNQMLIDDDFEKLKTRFKEGVVELNKLMNALDLEEKLEHCRNEPRLQLFIVAITHNSYHTGQIMMLRNILRT